MKYEGDITDAMSNVKRLYVDGLVIKRNCPECGQTVERDYSDHYISYGEEDIDLYCSDGCEHEWTIKATLSAKLILVTDE